jgi:hypothetical protein
MQLNIDICDLPGDEILITLSTKAFLQDLLRD